jgi:hypothetical protein
MTIRKPRNQALTESVREIGRPTTPDELQRRGVRVLRSVGMSEVSRLIEIAVNRTLMDRTTGVSTGEMKQLVSEAQDTMGHLLRSKEELAASRDELLERRRELQKDLADLKTGRLAPTPGRHPHDEHLFQNQLRIELIEMLGERAARAVAMRAAHVLRRTRIDGPDERDERIVHLERRISKLVNSLEHAEEAIARISKMKDVDIGVASLYRVVQGLTDNDGGFEAKAKMMTSIFEANVKLQKSAG